MENLEVKMGEHTQQIKTLFAHYDDIKNKVDDINTTMTNLIIEIKELSKTIDHNNTLLEKQIFANSARIESLENDRQYKNRKYFDWIVGGLVGGIIAYIISLFFKTGV